MNDEVLIDMHIGDRFRIGDYTVVTITDFYAWQWSDNEWTVWVVFDWLNEETGETKSNIQTSFNNLVSQIKRKETS